MSRRRQLASFASLAVVALVATIQLWPGLSDDLSPPISWDHGSHLGKAMLTAQELLPFSLRGWTDLVECGVPLGTLCGAGDVEKRLAQGFRFLAVGGDGGPSGSVKEAVTIGRKFRKP